MLHISDDESSMEEFRQNLVSIYFCLREIFSLFQEIFNFNFLSMSSNPRTQQQQQIATKSHNRTMPKFNQSQNHLTRQTQQHQQNPVIITSPLSTVAKGGNGMSLMKSNQGIVVRKIPPAPPKRKIFRADPDGMQTTEYHEKKNVPSTVTPTPIMLPPNITNSTSNSKPRIPPKPLITFIAGQQQQRKQFHFHQQQNLLNLNQSQAGVIFIATSPTSNLNLNNSTNLYHQLPQQHQPPSHLQTISANHRPKQQLKQQHYVPSSRAGEKSDPENHIYEMIDDYEVNNHNLQQQQVSNHRPAIVDGSDDEAKERVNMFQDLLRAEMMNQMQSCSKNLNSGGFLSHLTKEKRMDIIQETALSIATTTYHEK